MSSRSFFIFKFFGKDALFSDFLRIFGTYLAQYKNGH